MTPMRRVLVVEDDAKIAQLLLDYCTTRASMPALSLTYGSRCSRSNKRRPRSSFWT
jgi:hypothetical protein